MVNRKGIAAVVSMALLLVVTVVAVVNFQSWITEYNSGMFAGNEKKTDILLKGDIFLDKIVGSELFIINNLEDNLTILELKLGGVDCNISDNLSLGIQNISLSECIDLVKSNSVELFLYTDKGVKSKEFYLQKVSGGSLNSVASSGGSCVNIDNTALAGLWHFDDNWNDSSSNLNDGSAINGANFSSSDSMFGSAANFDGVDDYVTVLDDSSLELGSDFTISMWVKSDKTHLGTLISKGSGTEDSNTEYSLSVANRMFINSAYQDEIIAPSDVGMVTVHGEPFAGNIITVGNDGKYAYDYTDPRAAVTAALAGDLILIYPGTYSFPSSFSITKNLYVRGMGRSANDVTLSTPTDVWHTMRVDGSLTKVVVENLRSIAYRAYSGAFVFRDANPSLNAYLNKLNLVAQNSGYVVYFGDTLTDSDYKGNAFLSNVNIDRGYASLREVGRGSSTSTISLKKVRYLESYVCNSCSRNPSPHDSRTSATIGYGHTYGDYLINFFQNPYNTWSHLAVVYDTSYTPAKLLYYIDGSLVNDINVTGSYTANLAGNFYFGSRGSSYNRYRGLMDDVAIYKRVLSSAEISSIAGSSGPICD